MHTKKLYVANDGTEFYDREDCERYEAGGEHSEKIAEFLATCDFSALSDRAEKSQRKIAARWISNYLAWSEK